MLDVHNDILGLHISVYNSRRARVKIAHYLTTSLTWPARGAAPVLDRANFSGLVLGGGGGGRPDYLQKLKVPEGYEKFSAVSKPNFASK